MNGESLRLSGRLDGTASADVRDSLHLALVTGSGPLLVDLSDVQLIDATGLGVLVGANRLANQLGRRLVLCGVPPRLRRILLVTRLDRILTIESQPVVAA
jgi:anti-sigma B factor antagonist